MRPLDHAIAADLRRLDAAGFPRAGRSWGPRGTGRFRQRPQGDTRPAPVARRMVDPDSIVLADLRAARLPHPHDR